MNPWFRLDGLRFPGHGARNPTGGPWWTIAALAAVFVFALILRLDNLVRWQELPHAYFADDAPMLLNVDGYYYLDLARDLAEGSYKPVDLDRVVPDGRPRPLPPPLLPVLAASVQKLSGASFEWVGVVLPAVVGAFIVLPVFALGYRLGGGVMALVAALAAAASPHYLQRTTLGWFDTDGLVVVLPLAIAWALMRFAETGGAHRWRYLAAAVVLEMVMLWWWDFGLGPSLAAFVLPFAVAVFLYPNDRMTRRWLVVGAGLFVAFLATLKPGVFWDLLGKFFYVFEIEENVFPVSGANVSEQRAIPLPRLVREAMFGWAGFLVGVAGLAWLAMIHRRRMLFLAFPFIVGCLSLSAARFIIFLAPLLALGVGMVAQGLWNLRTRSRLAAPATAVFASLVALQLYAAHGDDDRMMPLRMPYQARAMMDIASSTPANALIWADWSHGYPIQYFARRGTFADGASHSGRQVYVISYAMSVASPRVSANWIRFFAYHGIGELDRLEELFGRDWDATVTALEEIFEAGPAGASALLAGRPFYAESEQRRWLEYFFPPEPRPIYLFLDYDKIRTPWLTYGAWNFTARTGPEFVHEPVLDVVRKNGVIGNDNNFNVDVATGVARYNSATFPLKQMLVHGRGLRRIRDRGLTFEYFEPQGWGVLVDDNALPTVARQLYSGRFQQGPGFRVEMNRLPYAALWKVVPDPLPGPG